MKHLELSKGRRHNLIKDLTSRSSMAQPLSSLLSYPPTHTKNTGHGGGDKGGRSKNQGQYGSHPLLTMP